MTRKDHLVMLVASQKSQEGWRGIRRYPEVVRARYLAARAVIAKVEGELERSK